MNKKIMVADDDLAIVDATMMIFEYEGYEVASTTNGRSLLELGDDIPDLLILDIWMSGEDGKEICRQLKSQVTTKNMPIIMVSASRDIEKSARDAGADDFLAKPFSMDEMLNLTHKYLAA